MIELLPQQKIALNKWISDLREREPIAIIGMGNFEDFEADMPVSGYCGDIEIRVFKFSELYLVATNDPTEISKVETYNSLESISKYINEFQTYARIIKEDALGTADWNFDVRSFNTMRDEFQNLPKELGFLTCPELISILTSDEFSVSFF